MAVCTHCGEEFEPRQKGQGFCSAACNAAYRLSDELTENRFAAFVRDDWKCQDCGKAHTYFEAHHIIGCAEGGSHALENLITLCAICHDKRHNKTPRAIDNSGKPAKKSGKKEDAT